MKCQCDLAARLASTVDSSRPYVVKVDKDFLPRGAELEASELANVIDSLGAKSALVRGLQTDMEDNRLPSIQKSDDTVYLLAEGCYVLGFARVAVRHLLVAPSSDSDEPPTNSKSGYAAYGQSLQKLSSCALLDFYVVSSFQRRGLGRMLLDEAVKHETLAHPGKLAFSRISDVMSQFLKKHYKLEKSRQSTSYLLFEEFFAEALPEVPPVQLLPGPARGLKNGLPSSTIEGTDADEPQIDEPCDDVGCCNDPLAPYRLVEKEFYAQRTKMYCFNENQWQDAGAGQVTFMKNETSGRVRLVFVQDKDAGGRLIANHFIVNKQGMCELERHTAGNDKTWTWTAKERVLERRFALKFKSVENAAEFKEAFNEVKRLSTESEAQPYMVLQMVGATADAALNSRHIQVIEAGSKVQVLEACYDANEKRVRGRIVSPAGWITVMSHNGIDAGCYAVMAQDLEAFASLQASSLA